MYVLPYTVTHIFSVYVMEVEYGNSVKAKNKSADPNKILTIVIQALESSSHIANIMPPIKKNAPMIIINKKKCVIHGFFSSSV